MMMKRICLLLVLLVILPLCESIWPHPKETLVLNGSPVSFSEKAFTTSTFESKRLYDAFERFKTHVTSTESTESIHSIEFEIVDPVSEDLDMSTNVSYAIETKEEKLVLSSETIYGAMYALETLKQLLDRSGNLMYSNIHIRDAPQYSWRGLMIDSGRRFVPVDTMKNLLDTMSATKLNVLHLHASDFCRFGVESKIYPNLTEALTGIHAGFYSQSDVADLVGYAADRGVRIVPEFDIPGHSRGFVPVQSQGLTFCEPESETKNQLHGTNGTYEVLRNVLGEMSKLFPDKVFNIGSDETAAKGDCTQDDVFALERRVLNTIREDFKKTPMGWEEVLFNAGAATNDTIVNAWSRHTAADVVATGHRAVESKSSAFYFTDAATGGPSGWKKCWYDISTNVKEEQKHLLLGGEMSTSSCRVTLNTEM